jgi:DNA-binding transcriptional LysR family regulator
VELRQLRYFVTLAEELHFGRAAAREHIVQSALSQQIQRLERELRVRLVDRSTHHVQLTTAGDTLLVEARQVLGRVEHTVAAVRAAPAADTTIRVAVGDASCDAMIQVLAAVRDHHPRLVDIHQIEASVPDQYELLAAGRLDIGIGRAAYAPEGVASELIRHDRFGVLVGHEHRLAQRDNVAVAELEGERMLFSKEGHAPELNQFVRELCRSVGFTPQAYPGTVPSVLCAAPLVQEGRALLCTPRSYAPPIFGLRWLPMVEPVSHYPLSLLWRADEETAAVGAVRCCARRVATRLSWTDCAETQALPIALDG